MPSFANRLFFFFFFDAASPGEIDINNIDFPKKNQLMLQLDETEIPFTSPPLQMKVLLPIAEHQY